MERNRFVVVTLDETLTRPLGRATWPASLALHGLFLSLLLVAPLLRADAPPEPVTPRFEAPLVLLPPPPSGGGGDAMPRNPTRPPPRPASAPSPDTFVAPSRIDAVVLPDWDVEPELLPACAHCSGPVGSGRGPGDPSLPPGPGVGPALPPPPPAALLRVHRDVTPPRKLRDVVPEYPDLARRTRTEGIVIIECTIDARGRVVNAVVLRGKPFLNEAALDAVRQWVYTPTLLNGVAVPVIMTVTLNFDLD